MSTTRIYQARQQTVHELLEQACGSRGATLLIPDLQRPYVWSPQQVTLLVDSLIRGWPFGTLLLWSVPDQHISSIPYRTFWSTVDRSKNGDGAHVTQREPPAAYQMVLDGQQRLQSLILAVGGDSWGFKLLDKEWFAALEQQRPRGRATGHWSNGQLCIDLLAFRAEYMRQGEDVESIDYRDVLQWVVRNVHNGLSRGPTSHNYSRPLKEASKEASRYVRLSRLWEIAKPRAQLSKVYRDSVRSLLDEHAVTDIDATLEPICELVSVLGQVKEAPVTFLELRKFDADSFRSAERYNNAIVNIFTRLNTAGRVLTNQEIIFAWIKRNWLPSETSGRSADECFNQLRDQLVVRKLELEMDDLVRGVAVLWSVICHQGLVLSSRELLRGDVIEQMAPALAIRWQRISENIEACGDLAQALELEHGTHYESLNSLFVLWAWRMIAVEWVATSGLGLMARDSFLKRIDDIFRTAAERWIILSHWSGRWRSAGGTTLESYLKELSTLCLSVQATKLPDTVADQLAEVLARWIEDLRPGAEKYIDDLTVEHRGEVQRYFVPLWIWHRLDANRWEQSRVQLRVGRKKLSLDVDHIVSCKWWETNLEQLVEERDLAEEEPLLEAEAEAGENAGARTAGQLDPVEGGALVEDGALNDIGNCFLLWRSFNISKSDRSLKSFLAQVYEFKDAQRLETWKSALGIAQPQLDPEGSDSRSIRSAIAKRTQAIKADLRKFIAGTELPAHDRPPFDVSGRWSATSQFDGESDAFEMTLAQTDDRLVGSYGTEGRIEGKLEGTQFDGSWSEPNARGVVTGMFDEEGRIFAAHWRYARGRKVGNWSARRIEDK